MAQAASEAHAFYRQVADEQSVWTVRDAGGFPAPMTASGRRAQPFWSSKSRVQRIIKNVPAYSGFEPFEVPWTEFENEWVAKLDKDEILVGVNWSGKRAVGYDMEPLQVVHAVYAAMGKQPPLD